MKCIGGDPLCPCQDGLACHYRDTADGTKAFPLPSRQKQKPVRDKAYRRWVASLPCAHCGLEGHSQAAHADQGKGMGIKASDTECFPLCADRLGVQGCHSIIGASGFTGAELLRLCARHPHFDVVLATGVAPRLPDIPGIDHPMVLTYPEAIYGAKLVGHRVAVIGAGGIGFDVSELLVTDESPTLNLKDWKAEWGVVDPQEARGALVPPIPASPAREVYLLQRTKGPQGRKLGKTTGWVHRASLKAKGVEQLSGVNYERIDDAGLHISFGSDRKRPRLLAVDNVVICAGQESVRDLADASFCYASLNGWQDNGRLEPLLDIDVNSPEAQVLRLQLSMIRSGVDSIPSVYVFNDDFTESSFCRRSTSRLSLELRP